MLATRHNSPRWELLGWTEIAAHLSDCLATPKAADRLSQHLILQGSFLPRAILGAFWGLRGCVYQRPIVKCLGKVCGHARWGEQDDLASAG